MTEPVAADTAAEPATPETEPQATATAPPAAPARKSLEDSLASLDEDTRKFVLGEVQSARSEAKNLRERVKEAEPIVAQWRQLEEASKTELQKAQEAATQSAERATQLVNRAVRAEIKALAADLFADPSDAAAFLDVSKYATDDGDVDTERISADLAELLTKKPHLGKPQQKGMPPNPAQGATAAPSSNIGQLSREDLARMTPEQINTARKEGRLNNVLGVAGTPT